MARHPHDLHEPQLEHDQVQADAAAIKGIASDLSNRLNSSLWIVQNSLTDAEKGTDHLIGISKIGRF